MSRTSTGFTRTVIVGAGLFVAATALSAQASAVPFKTGGEACIEQSAGAAGLGAAAIPCAGAPVADMAGVPMALPGPIPAIGAAAGALPAIVPPIPAVVPPVPAVVPPVPAVVPPVPAVVPPVPVVVPPVGAGAGALPLPVGAAAVGAPLPVGAPILDMGGYGGKGVPTGPPPADAPLAGQPIIPGPPPAS